MIYSYCLTLIAFLLLCVCMCRSSGFSPSWCLLRGVGKLSSHALIYVDIFHMLVPRDFVLTESRIPLKLVLGGEHFCTFH